MTYQPDVVVELAFGSGYSTPAASRTWTDVSTYVEAAQGITIGFGRADELSTADANTLSLTLDNSDGRFTAGLASGAYYPDVKIGTPIRVTTTPVGGTASVRFVGFVDEWPVAWDGTDNYASATITATSRLARLGLDAGLRSIAAETINADAPVAYYPFNEEADAGQANDIASQGATALYANGGWPVFEFGVAIGVGTDESTGLAMYGGQYLWSSIHDGPTTSGAMTIEGFFVTTGTGGTLFRNDVIYASLSGGYLFGGRLFGGYTASASRYDDGALHHVAVTVSGTTAALYADGVHLGNATIAAYSGEGTLAAGEAFVGTLAHFAIFDYALSAGQIAEHAEAGLTGFAGESTDDRMARYAALAGVAATETNFAAGTTDCDHVDATDATAVDLMRQVETTEFGVLFDAPDGTLMFHGRAHRLDATAAVTLDMGAHLVGSDFSPKLDRTGLANDATVTNIAGGVVGRSIDTDSRDYYGPAVVSLTTLSTDADEPPLMAAWIVATRAEPIPRVPTLTVNLLDFDASPSQNDVLALTIGDRVDVDNLPSQAAASTESYFVEGYTETITEATYDLTFNVSPAATWLGVSSDFDAWLDPGLP